jgi:CubicO group peptidase (beta-lactamase class C family)
MSSCRLTVVLALAATLTAFAQERTLPNVAPTISNVEPKLPGIGTAMEEMIAKNEIAGAITVVVTKDKVLHFETTGLADVAAKRPMTPDRLFWIASMTKPVTGVSRFSCCRMRASSTSPIRSRSICPSSPI